LSAPPTILDTRQLPYWVRWASLLWLAIWIPSYAVYWGWVNFLHVCDVAVFLTCIGLATSNALLLSSQAVSSLVADLLWCLDAGSRWFVGRHLLGGTEYMWDRRYPLWLRLLSLFHVVLPLLLLAALRRTGYDRRALRVQSAIAAGVLLVSLFCGPGWNLNYVFAGPIFHRSFGPAPVHLILVFAALVALIYWPTHRLLLWACDPKSPSP
jgi:hypothetical protein